MRKTLKVPSRKFVRICASDLSGGMNSFTDSRVLPFSRGEAAYNVTVESGALRDGYGVAALTYPSAYEKIFCYKAYDEQSKTMRFRLLAYEAQSGKIFYRDDGADAWNEIEGVRFSTVPMGCDYRLYGEDVFLLCGQEGMCVVYGDLHAVAVSSAPDITSIAMHNERMFVTIGGRKNAVWFSDDLDPTNWNPELDEGGFIELEGERGRLNRVVAFGGYIYIFRDYGISRLTAWSGQSDFSVTNLFVSSGKIFADTVAVCGDRILFGASDGLYTFDGFTAARIARHLDGVLCLGQSAKACYVDGKYFLSSASADGDGMLTVIDPRQKTTSVNVKMAIREFSPIVTDTEQKLWVCASDASVLGEVRLGEGYFGQPVLRTWRSGMSDLGAPDKRKLISDVFLDTAYDCTVTVSTERGERRFTLHGKNEVQRKRVNLIGTKVRFAVEATGHISVARPTIRYTTV